MLFSSSHSKHVLPDKASALPGRTEPLKFNPRHFISGQPIVEPVPEGLEKAIFGLGCFWGAERLFWQLEGVFSTAVGYAGGLTAHPTYEEVCSGQTGHTEVVLVYYDPNLISYEKLLTTFWESHDPTQGMRQGNDRGTQYRSAIYPTTKQQIETSLASQSRFQTALSTNGYDSITTENKELERFYYAEDYHQQYLAKNPGGYCGLAGTGCALNTNSA